MKKKITKKKPILDIYRKVVRYGRLTGPGLCYMFHSSMDLFLIVPSKEDRIELLKIGGPYYETYWGYGETIRPTTSRSDVRYKVTPLRENLLLLLAALNGEL